MSRPFIASCIAVVMAVSLAIDVRAERIDPSRYVDVALILAMDTSTSMDQQELRIMKDGHAAALEHTDFLHAVEQGPLQRISVAVVVFASTAQLQIDWQLIDGSDSAARLAQRIRNLRGYTRGTTCVACALKLAGQMFDDNPYIATRQVVDIVGDGEHNANMPGFNAVSLRPAAMEFYRDILTEQGVTINGMPIMVSPGMGTKPQPNLDEWFAENVVGGPGAFNYPVDGWDNFRIAIRRKIIMDLM